MTNVYYNKRIQAKNHPNDICHFDQCLNLPKQRVMSWLSRARSETPPWTNCLTKTFSLSRFLFLYLWCLFGFYNVFSFCELFVSCSFNVNNASSHMMICDVIKILWHHHVRIQMDEEDLRYRILKFNKKQKNPKEIPNRKVFHLYYGGLILTRYVGTTYGRCNLYHCFSVICL